MRRREFITLLGGAAVAWPLAARAQNEPSPRHSCAGRRAIGQSQRTVRSVSSQGLKDLRLDRGAERVLRISFCRRQSGCVGEARRGVGSIASGRYSDRQHAGNYAAKNATHTIPIVMAAVLDPVASGFVASLSRARGEYNRAEHFGAGLGRQAPSTPDRDCARLSARGRFSKPFKPRQPRCCSSQCKHRRKCLASSFMSWRHRRRIISRARSRR